MDFGIKDVTIFTHDWRLFVFLCPYSFYGLIYVLIIWIGCDVCTWHFLETRDGFYPVHNKRDLEETSVGYYPVAHGRYFGVHTRVLSNATSRSPRVHTNQSVTGNQRATPILK